MGDGTTKKQPGEMKALKSAGKRTKSASSKPGKKSGKKSGKKGRSKSAAITSPIDIMSEAAMENLQYIAHEPQGALVMRGFPWSGAGKKKKKGKGKKKKK